tara:strand:+ start:842 stop:1159 length:318 start_codon:yes stop_codon:yes gene_type:complete
MGVVFVVLALLAIAIKAIGMLDREPASTITADSFSEDTTAVLADNHDRGITKQQVAAVALAFALSQPTAINMATISRRESTGSWLQAGRMRELSSVPSGVREAGR